MGRIEINYRGLKADGILFRYVMIILWHNEIKFVERFPGRERCSLPFFYAGNLL